MRDHDIAVAAVRHAQHRVGQGWPDRRAGWGRNRKLPRLGRQPAGHSPSDTLFWDADHALLIGGDHLIRHISSNPLISRPLGGKSGEPGDGRPRALMMYMRSMSETREMPVETVLPGHGEPVTDHVKLIDERFALHERRAAKIGGLIAERPHDARTRSRSRCGATWRSRRLPHAVARCSGTSTC